MVDTVNLRVHAEAARDGTEQQAPTVRAPMTEQPARPDCSAC